MFTRKLIWALALCLCWLPTAYALDWTPDAVSFTYGQNGDPGDHRAYRGDVRWDWHVRWFETTNWHLGGYFAGSVGYWRAEHVKPRFARDLFQFSIVPMFRIARHTPYNIGIAPFIEGGVGVAWLTEDKFGDRDLGHHSTFDDRIGAGIRFGSNQQFELAYHYLHYSNAGLHSPNQGIDMSETITFAYHF